MCVYAACINNMKSGLRANILNHYLGSNGPQAICQNLTILYLVKNWPKEMKMLSNCKIRHRSDCKFVFPVPLGSIGPQAILGHLMYHGIKNHGTSIIKV